MSGWMPSFGQVERLVEFELGEGDLGPVRAGRVRRAPHARRGPRHTLLRGRGIASVGLVLTGDTTSQSIQLAFDDGAPVQCSNDGVYDNVNHHTSYTCDLTQSVSTATKFALIAE